MAKKARPAKAKSQRAKEPKSQRAKEPKRALRSIRMQSFRGHGLCTGMGRRLFPNASDALAIVQPEPVRTAICRCAAADSGLRLRVTALKVG